MFICCVKQLDSDDISMLFKNIVVLPSYKSQPRESEEKSKITQDLESFENQQSQSIAKETKADYNIDTLVILLPKDLHITYKKGDSAFMRIITSLGLKKIAKYITHEIPKKEIFLQKNCVWAIGWDISTEKKLINFGHVNLLVSPEISKLSSKEEKLAMFLPLKKFVSDNIEHFSKLS